MFKNLDTFYTAVVIFVILAVVIPLLFAASVIFIGRGQDVEIKVVTPGNNQDLSYQQKLQEAYNSGDEGVNPNLSHGNDNPKQYKVEISDGIVSKPLIDIRRGDTVVFYNNSQKPVKVVGGSWGSGEYIPPYKNYAQTFGIRGTFEYSVVGLSSVYGKIQVR